MRSFPVIKIHLRSCLLNDAPLTENRNDAWERRLPKPIGAQPKPRQHAAAQGSILVQSDLLELLPGIEREDFGNFPARINNPILVDSRLLIFRKLLFAIALSAVGA